jgi:hypothetical protein
VTETKAWVVKHLYSGRYLSERDVWTQDVVNAQVWKDAGEAQKATEGHPGAFVRRIA